MYAFRTDQRRLRCFATFEASASADDIRMLVDESHRAGIHIERSADSPLGLDWFDICADENDLNAAVESTSAVLLALDAAAERGGLRDFRVLFPAGEGHQIMAFQVVDADIGFVLHQQADDVRIAPERDRAVGQRSRTASVAR